MLFISLVTYSRNRGEKTMKERLAKEILDAVNNTGEVLRREKTLTRWLKLTRLLHITDSNKGILFKRKGEMLLWQDNIHLKIQEILV